jgi:hypothetical protein
MGRPSETVQKDITPQGADLVTGVMYDAYGRDNPYTITFQNDKTDPTKTDAVQTTLFKFVPSISYDFKF